MMEVYWTGADKILLQPRPERTNPVHTRVLDPDQVEIPKRRRGRVSKYAQTCKFRCAICGRKTERERRYVLQMMREARSLVCGGCARRRRREP